MPAKDTDVRITPKVISPQKRRIIIRDKKNKIPE